MKIAEEAYERAKKIRLVIFDVDGVLTDGGIYMGESGELFKSFNWHYRGTSRRTADGDFNRSPIHLYIEPRERFKYHGS